MDSTRWRKFCIGCFGREDGATAILIALLTLFVFLPLAGVATSTFIRSGVITELQLAADAGALAGAASIPLGDADFAAFYVEQTANVPPIEDVDPPGDEGPIGVDEAANDAIDDAIRTCKAEQPNLCGSPGTPTPRDIACTQALTALDNNGLLGRAFASTPLDPSTQCVGGEIKAAGLTIETAYLPDIAFLTEFGGCGEKLAGPDPTGLLGSLGGVLPALLKPGIKVTVTRGVRPPLETLADPAELASDLHSASGAARRRFKNAVVLPGITATTPEVPNPLPHPPPLPEPLPTPSPLPDPIAPSTTNTVDLGEVADDNNVDFERARNDTLEQLETLEEALVTQTSLPFPDETGLEPVPVGPLPIPSGCTGIFAALRDDFVDVANPPERGSPTRTDVLTEAAQTGATALVLVFIAGTPFFDFFPVCVEQSGNEFVGIKGVGCTANAPGAFRAALAPR